MRNIRRLAPILGIGAVSGVYLSSPTSCQWTTLPPLPVHMKEREKEEAACPPPLPKVISSVFPALCKVQGSLSNGTRMGGGSGFVVSEDGVVVTNDHVLSALLQAGATEVVAIFDDGRVHALEPLASDREADISILKIIAPRGSTFPYLRFASSGSLARGDTVVVLGAPLGGSLVPAVGVLGGDKHVADDDLMIRVLRSQSDWNLLQVSVVSPFSPFFLDGEHSSRVLTPVFHPPFTPLALAGMQTCRLAPVVDRSLMPLEK